MIALRPVAFFDKDIGCTGIALRRLDHRRVNTGSLPTSADGYFGERISAQAA